MTKNKEIMQALWSMQIHDEIFVPTDQVRGYYVMRVPGGWMYRWYSANHPTQSSSQFVPLNNEFTKTVL